MKQRSLAQEFERIQLGQPVLAVGVSLLNRPRVEELTCVVPLVERLIRIDPLVTLEADEFPAERPGDRHGKFGLPDPHLALEKKGSLHLDSEINGGCQPFVSEVTLL